MFFRILPRVLLPDISPHSQLAEEIVAGAAPNDPSSHITRPMVVSLVNQFADRAVLESYRGIVDALHKLYQFERHGGVLAYSQPTRYDQPKSITRNRREGPLAGHT